MRKLIEGFLEDGIPDMAIGNCHAVGLDSIVLDVEYDELTNDKVSMTRVFVAWHDLHTLDALYQPDGHFSIGAHNHRYDLTITPLVGVLNNYEVDFSHDGWGPLHQFAYTSAIADGEMSFKREGERYFARPPLSVELWPGWARVMDAEQVHSVVVKKAKAWPFTAWMVREGPDRIASKTFSPLDHIPDRHEPLYQPLEPEYAETVMEQVLGLMRPAPTWGDLYT